MGWWELEFIEWLEHMLDACGMAYPLSNHTSEEEVPPSPNLMVAHIDGCIGEERLVEEVFGDVETIHVKYPPENLDFVGHT